MQVTLFFLDKHTEEVPLAEAKIKCFITGGVIMDAETEDSTTKSELRAIIDRDTWLIDKQRSGSIE